MELDSLGRFLGREEAYGSTALRCVLLIAAEGEDEEDEDDDVGRGGKDLLVLFISLPRG